MGDLNTLRDLRERRGFTVLEGIMDDVTADQLIAICDRQVFEKHPAASVWWVSALSMNEERISITCLVEIPPEDRKPYVFHGDPGVIPGWQGVPFLYKLGLARYMMPVTHHEPYRVTIERCDLSSMVSGTASSSSAS